MPRLLLNSRVVSVPANDSQSLFQVLSLFMAAHSSGSDGRSIAFIPTSLHMLDAALHGGLPRGTVTEVSWLPFYQINTVKTKII